MEILKDEVTFRVKKLFKANVSNNLGARTLNGIASFSYDKMIQFMKVYISIYFTSLEDKDHSSGVIECIYDDAVKDKFYKKGIVLIFEGNENEEWGWYHQQKETSCQKKSTSVCDSTVQTTTNSTSKQNNIPDLTPPILTPTNPTMSNPVDMINKLKKMWYVW